MSEDKFITVCTPINDALLMLLAHLPTKSLDAVGEASFFAKLTDADLRELLPFSPLKAIKRGVVPLEC